MSSESESRRRLTVVLATILLVAGVGVLATPWLTTTLQGQRMSATVSTFHQTTQSTAASGRWDGLFEAMQAHNAQLARNGQAGLVDPFAYEAPGIDLSSYGVVDGLLGSVAIPAIDVKVPVYAGASMRNLDRGAAVLGQTSLPAGGASTNMVVAGHRAPGMFWDLHLLEPGDRVEVRNARETMSYEVFETVIIRPDEITEVLIQDGRDLVTLLACHPLRENNQRILVRAERVIDGA